MNEQRKKAKIKSMTLVMLRQSHKEMVAKIDKVLNSGAVDIDSWEENNNPMILPKCIVVAIMQGESSQYDGAGTSFEKQIKKEVANIRCFV
jgi:hypothetical protein